MAPLSCRRTPSYLLRCRHPRLGARHEAKTQNVVPRHKPGHHGDAAVVGGVGGTEEGEALQRRGKEVQCECEYISANVKCECKCVSVSVSEYNAFD